MATILNACCVRLQRRLFAQLRTDVNHYDYSIQRYSPRPDSKRAAFYEQRGRRPVLIEGLVRDLNRKRALRTEKSSSEDKGSEKRDKRKIFNL